MPTCVKRMHLLQCAGVVLCNVLAAAERVRRNLEALEHSLEAGTVHVFFEDLVHVHSLQVVK